MLTSASADDLQFILDAAPDSGPVHLMFLGQTVPAAFANSRQALSEQGRPLSPPPATRSSIPDILSTARSPVAPNDRQNASSTVLRYYDAKNAIVFCSTRATVNHSDRRLFQPRLFRSWTLSGETEPETSAPRRCRRVRDGPRQGSASPPTWRPAPRFCPISNLSFTPICRRTPKALLHRSGRTDAPGRKGSQP